MWQSEKFEKLEQLRKIYFYINFLIFLIFRFANYSKFIIYFKMNIYFFSKNLMRKITEDISLLR